MKTTVLSSMLLAISLNGMAQEAAAQLTAAYQHSAFALFNALAGQEKENVCFSPLSVQMALSMMQDGAAGNTLTQLQRVLGTEGFSNEEMGQFNQNLTQTLTARPPYKEEYFNFDPEMSPQDVYDGMYPVCELANSLWHRPDVHPYDDFVQALRGYYDAGVDAVQFNTWEGIRKINDWASERTHGMIPEIYKEPQSDDLAVVLANALYFKGSWTVHFWRENTQQGTFLLNDKTYAQVDMMFARNRYDCALTPSFRTITLYYGADGNFTMTLFVPLEGTALPPLTYDDWSASRKTADLHINLYMPRFEVTGNYNLNEVLKDMGMTDAFDPQRADFTKMCEVNRAIGRVSQLSKIQVDEEGAEAAAITVIEMPDGIDLTKPEDYQDFRVDRPFYFTIQSRDANAILFAGRVSMLDGPQGDLTVIRDITDPSFVNSESSNGTSFDLSGRRLTTPSTKGIYIRDGRKVLVK